MQPRGYFISIEGIEGMGKSTALQYITTQLQQAHVPHITTREPGGTEIAENIRDLLLQHYHEPMDADTELLLMFACRAQHVAAVIKPALNKGLWVITDRFVDASYAYQGGGRGIALQRIAGLADWVLDDFLPDLTFLLDAPATLGLERIHSRGGKDRIESEGLTFLEKVRQAYLQRAHKEPHRFAIIDATQTIAEVHQNITAHLQLLLKKI